ncbi:MAG: RluA family pseudouridine synthase, partial [Planctomycetota bacterium]
ITEKLYLNDHINFLKFRSIKPPGMLVHPVGRHVYNTLINYLHHRYHEKDENVVPRLCHRLDKDTTGLVVVAKDAYVHREVMYQFENRLLHKEYLALVHGRLPEGFSRVDLPIGEGRCLRSSLEHEQLKPSSTSLATEAEFEDYALIRCTPHTGRQNQIRIHLSASGYPIVGDQRFGNVSPPFGFPQRHLLHSEKLRFYHPRLKTDIELCAPPAADFQTLVEELAHDAP